jgi:hypothetical protein
MARKTKAQKQAEDHIEKLVGRALVGNQVDIMDINKVFNVAEGLVASGLEDALIAVQLQSFVQSIRKE